MKSSNDLPPGEKLLERHEFHMLDHFTAYCLCGWAGDDRLLSSKDSTTPAAFIGKLYRKHLEEATR